MPWFSLSRWSTKHKQMRKATMHIGLLYVRFFMESVHSLKEKRMILKSLKDKVRRQFNVSVAELGDQDKWQSATVGFCMIGNDQKYIDRTLQNILSFLGHDHTSQMIDHQIEFV